MTPPNLSGEELDRYFATTVLTFADGSREGQVLCVDTLEKCEQTAKRISAISYSGEGSVTDSRIIIIPLSEQPDAVAGMRWRNAALAVAREKEKS